MASLRRPARRPLLQSACLPRSTRPCAILIRWNAGRPWASTIGSSPDALAERQRGDLDYWRRMIEFTGVKVE